MDTLVQICKNSVNNAYIYNHHSVPAPCGRAQHDYDANQPPPPFNHRPTPSTPALRDEVETPDHYDSVLKFLDQMLMEEDDLQEKPCMFNECLALQLQIQAAEKSLYDVLINKQDDSSTPGIMISDDSSHNFSTAAGYYPLPQVTDHLQENDSFNNRRKRNPSGEEEEEEQQSAKHHAAVLELESDDDDLLLCYNEPEQTSSELSKRINGSSKRGRPRGKKNTNTQELVIDLRNLLTQCAQAITNNDPVTSYELLRKIKQHSSPHGDSTERLAHYFANAIDARLAGTGAEFYRSFKLRKISAAEILRSYHTYMMACPFHRMSNILANKSIEKLSRGKKKLHIIDFGILYGFQWPCFIKSLSTRRGGPPMLRITGIDLPQPGLCPAERVELTGRRLAKFCNKFNVPFKYKGIAKKWEDVKVEELGLERDELTVVNSLYRLRNVLDETVVESSPRDTVLRLIRQINPDMFVHGVLNGTHNAPFLLNRFREALFHFSTLFDMYDATADRGNKHRLLFEQEVFGRDVMNVIACEGSSRVERPETYKQWQSRNTRAGFRQVPLYPEKVQEVKAKVRLNYHKDFLVDEDSNWMLQGWKGRVLYAISLWKPA